MEALQVLKCIYRRDLLFREEPSTKLEIDEDFEEVQQHTIEVDTERLGWDSLVEDLADNEGFIDHDKDTIYDQYL